MVSKEIEILEELSDEELFEEYKKMESGKSRWIEDIDDFNKWNDAKKEKDYELAHPDAARVFVLYDRNRWNYSEIAR